MVESFMPGNSRTEIFNLNILLDVVCRPIMLLLKENYELLGRVNLLLIMILVSNIFLLMLMFARRLILS